MKCSKIKDKSVIEMMFKNEKNLQNKYIFRKYYFLRIELVLLNRSLVSILYPYPQSRQLLSLRFIEIRQIRGIRDLPNRGA